MCSGYAGDPQCGTAQAFWSEDHWTYAINTEHPPSDTKALQIQRSAPAVPGISDLTPTRSIRAQSHSGM